jgi:hypothetical protein
MPNFPKPTVYLSSFSNSKGNAKQIYDILSKYKPSGPQKVGGGNNIVVSNNGASQGLKWDKSHSGQGVQF